MPGAALILALALARARVAQPPRTMVIAPAPNREVLMIRRAPDGSVETACVDNVAAEHAFLTGKPKSNKK